MTAGQASGLSSVIVWSRNPPRLFPQSRVNVDVRVAKSVLFLVAAFISGQACAQSPYRVEIDLAEQRAYLLEGRHIVTASPISSGRVGHLTETGSFQVIEKERNHYSSIYGKIVDASGRTIVSDADVDMRVPHGGKFVPAPMHYFMRFHGADGMHAGYLPGYPASHGCVRMPESYAIAFFDAVEVGTAVNVFGRTPRTRDYFRDGPQPFRFPPIFGPPQRDPRYYDPRFGDPWWR
jgi:lipoprotein-anchoring transpeptidase ErfK/SrfK